MKYIELFKFNLETLAKKEHIGNMYLNLFSLKPDLELEKDIAWVYELFQGKHDNIYGEGSKESWFAIWHKSIRQCDYFDNCYQKIKKELLTPEERKTRLELKSYFYDKNISDDIRNKRKTEEKDKFDEYMRLYRLKIDEENDERISGKIDSLLWNIIHVDKNNELSKVFRRTFLDIELETKPSEL